MEAFRGLPFPHSYRSLSISYRYKSIILPDPFISLYSERSGIKRSLEDSISWKVGNRDTTEDNKNLSFSHPIGVVAAHRYLSRLFLTMGYLATREDIKPSYYWTVHCFFKSPRSVVTGFSEILRTSGAIEDKGIYYWQGVQKDKEFYLQAFPRCETFASNTLNHVTFLQVGHSEPEF